MIKLLTQDTFLKNYSIYFIGSMIVAVFNYAFHPILGRLMNPADFGDIQALLSLLAQTAIIFGAFSVVTVNITTNTEDINQRNSIISELQKIAFWLVTFILIILVASLHSVQSFFNFSSLYPLIALVIILPIGAFDVFRSAYLQGTGAFADLSKSGVISAVGRLLFATSLLLIGLGTLGATLGIILANIAVMLYLYLKTRKTLTLYTKSNLHTIEKGTVRKELTYGVLVFFATGLVTLFYTMDILIIKKYFSADIAGVYSGVSAIAKIVFFAIGPSAAVLLSSIKIKNSFKENSKSLQKSIAIALIVGISCLIAFSVFYDIIIPVMIGAQYSSLSYLLPSVGLVMILSALLNIFVFYFLALRRFFLIWVSVFGMSCLGFILLKGHNSIEQVMHNLILSLSITIIFLILIYAKDYFNNRTCI